jgi:hypothetical protein
VHNLLGGQLRGASRNISYLFISLRHFPRYTFGMLCNMGAREVPEIEMEEKDRYLPLSVGVYPAHTSPTFFPSCPSRGPLSFLHTKPDNRRL